MRKTFKIYRLFKTEHNTYNVQGNDNWWYKLNIIKKTLKLLQK